MLTIDQIIMFNIQSVTCGDEATENYHPTVKLPAPLETCVFKLFVLVFRASLFYSSLSLLINLISVAATVFTSQIFLSGDGRE